MHVFELTAALLIFLSFAYFSFCENRKQLFLLFLIASLTVAAGEIVNIIHSTTIYNSNFLMIPGTNLPLFIVPLGAVISVWSFRGSIVFGRLYGSKKLAILIFSVISIIFPFFSEFAGIKLNIWRWNIPFSFSFFFLAGIWKFYFIFIFLPAFIFLLLSEKVSGKME